MAFKKGESGNPDGRPKGSKDKRTDLRVLLQPHAEDLVNKVVEKALEGDTTALRLCLDRLIPPYRAGNISVVLDDLEGTLTEKGEKIIGAMGGGEITPSDASSMLSALAAQSRVVEVDDIAKRVSELEKQNECKK
jgi:hypothetical protein